MSRGTISRFLNGNGYVSPAAREAISKAIDDVGFAPSMMARSLATRRTGTVLLLVASAHDPYFGDSSLGLLVSAANTRLSAADLQLVTIVVDGDRAVERVEALLRGGWADAVIFASMHRGHRLLDVAHELRLPSAMTGSPPAGTSISSAQLDNTTPLLALVAGLVDRGRRDVVMIGGPEWSGDAIARRRAFESTAAVGSRRHVSVAATWEPESGTAAMNELLAQHPNLDGVIAASDGLAFGALDALRAAGRRVPDDVSVVGFDDVPRAEFAEPPLTTVAQPFDLIGDALAELVIDRLQRGTEGRGVRTVPTEVVWRESV